MWHYGDTIGFKTAIERFPYDKLTIVLLANRSDSDPVALMGKVADLFLSPGTNTGCPAVTTRPSFPMQNKEVNRLSPHHRFVIAFSSPG
jgi:hypothetical protein